MEAAAAFCRLSHPSSISLIPPTTTTKQHYLISCKTNNYKHLSCFRSNSFTGGVHPRRYHVFRPTICAVDGRIPRKDKGNDNGDKNKPGIIAGLSTTVILACTVVGTIMCFNGRLMQAKALNIPAGLHDGDQNTNKLMTTPSMNQNYNPFSRSGRDQSSDLPASSDHSSSRSTTTSSISDISVKKQRILEIEEEALSMAPERGIKKLKSEYDKATKQDSMDLANGIEMLLVDKLIRQGKYNEALTRSCLSKYKTPEDVDSMFENRIYVYKIFLYLITGDDVQAETWFKGMVKNMDKSTG